MVERRDVVLLDVQDGESLAYNFPYDNLRLGAIEAALRAADINVIRCGVTSAAASLQVFARPILVVDAMHRVAGQLTPVLESVRVTRPDVEILCFGRAARAVWADDQLSSLIDHFAFTDEVHDVTTLVTGGGVEWVDVTPVRRAPERWSERGVVDIEATRGCEFRCTFCSVDTHEGMTRSRVWRARAPHEVVGEIARLVAETGMTRFQFVDDNLLGSPANSPMWIREFIRLLTKKNLTISFSAYARLDRTLLALLDELAGAGLVQLHAGVESGSDAVLRRLRKGNTTAEMARVIDQLRSYSVELVASLIVFEPRMSLGELDASLAWILGQQLERSFTLTQAIPFQGTRLREELASAGIGIGHDRAQLALAGVTHFADPRVEWVYHAAKAREQRVPPNGNATLEGLMRQRFRHEERLDVVEDPSPAWLTNLIRYRAEQIEALRGSIRDAVA